uniref:uncharacterized protein LOC120341613 n=1 Tax=Styela clava TaxID=7725 RepID=UPI00193A02CD|nr:uncharacterized protein LOC120341613 [Styela clava]
MQQQENTKTRVCSSPLHILLYGFTIVCLTYSKAFWDSWHGTTDSSTGNFYKLASNKLKVMLNRQYENQFNITTPVKELHLCDVGWEVEKLEPNLYELPRQDSSITHEKGFLTPTKLVEPIYDKPMFQLNPDKFFLPVLVGGPNNQIIGFQDSLFTAIKLNRTIVIPKFFKHFTDTQVTASRGLSYIYPGHRVNCEILCKFISCITLDQFQEACGHKVDAITNIRSIDAKGIAQLEGEFGMQITSNLATKESVRNEVHFVPNKLSSGKLNTSTLTEKLSTPARCLIHPRPLFDLDIRIDKNYEDPGKQKDSDLMKLVIQHTKHPEYISKIAEQFVNSTMRNRNFLTVHWRYNEGDYLKRCRNDIENSKNPRGDKRLEFCQNAINMKADGLASRIENKIDSLLDEIDVTDVYIASPYNVRNIVAEVSGILKLKRNWQVTSSTDLENYMEEKYQSCSVIQKHLNDILSTIEMEICGRGIVFLSSARSTWSSNVRFSRTINNDAGVFPKYDENVF